MIEKMNFMKFDKENGLGHYVMCNHRRKDSDLVVNSTKHVETRVCFSLESLNRFVEKMEVLHKHYPEYALAPIRVYCHINGVDLKKYHFAQIKYSCDHIQEGRMPKNLYGMLDSLCTIKETSFQKYSLIDYDDNMDKVHLVRKVIQKTLEYRNQPSTVDEIIIDEYNTKSGKHFIVKSFDFEQFTMQLNSLGIEKVNIQKNGFALLKVIE